MEPSTNIINTLRVEEKPAEAQPELETATDAQPEPEAATEAEPDWNAQFGRDVTMTNTDGCNYFKVFEKGECVWVSPSLSSVYQTNSFFFDITGKVWIVRYDVLTHSLVIDDTLIAGERHAHKGYFQINVKDQTSLQLPVHGGTRKRHVINDRFRFCIAKPVCNVSFFPNVEAFEAGDLNHHTQVFVCMPDFGLKFSFKYCEEQDEVYATWSNIEMGKDYALMLK
jgi:hypothetical protein